jgi:cellulose biosynthesis protein BcsQ
MGRTKFTARKSVGSGPPRRSDSDHDSTDSESGKVEHAQDSFLSSSAVSSSNPKRKRSVRPLSHRGTLVVACTSSCGGTGKTTTTVHVATELKNMGFRVLVVDLDKQANTTTVMCKIYNLELSEHDTKYGVVDFLRNKTDHQWEKHDVDYARDCIVALVSEDAEGGGELDLLSASSRELTRGTVYDQGHLRLKLALINSGCLSSTNSSRLHSPDIQFPPYDFIIIEAPSGQDEGFIQAMFAANTIIGCARPGGVDSYKGLFPVIDRHNGRFEENQVKMCVMVVGLVDTTPTGEIKSKLISDQIEDMKADAARRHFKLVVIPRTNAIIDGMLWGPLINDRHRRLVNEERSGSLVSSKRKQAVILGFEEVATILKEELYVL